MPVTRDSHNALVELNPSIGIHNRAATIASLHLGLIASSKALSPYSQNTHNVGIFMKEREVLHNSLILGL